jgi:hypothetical protein
MAINTTHKYFIIAEFRKEAMDIAPLKSHEYESEFHLIDQNGKYHIEIYFHDLQNIKKFIANETEEDITLFYTLEENPDYDPESIKKKALDEALGATLNPQF